jgi:hypothetical protein
MVDSIRPLRRAALALALSFSAAMPALAQETTNYSYTWWNASEPGWGYNLTHQGDVLYGTWYTYAGDGKPMFLTVEARLADDGSFSGPVYRVAGTPFQLINGTQAFTAVTEVGTATMRFDAEGKLKLDYTLDGTPTQSKDLERFTFDPAAPECVGTTESRASADNYSDLWWNATEPGWGLTLSHQGDIVFVLWYTYGDEGRDQWISGATLVKQADGSYAGALQRPTSGVPILNINGPATTFPVPEVGSASLSFSDGETGSFTYTLDGVTQTKAITRFVAVAADQPKPLCRVKEAGGGGNGDRCYPDSLPTGKSLDFRLSFLNGTTSAERTVVIGPDSFNGQAAIKSEQQTDGQVNEFFERFENGNILFIGSQSFQNGALVNDLRFNQFPTTPLAPVLNVVYDSTYTGTSFTAGAGTSAISYRESLVLRRREAVTVPAGTFENACFLERTIDVTASGFTIRTQFEVWTHPDIGEIKSIGRGSFPAPFETTRELTGFNLGSSAVESR